MRWTRRLRSGISVAVLVIYGVMIPLLGVNTTTAHKATVGGKWAYSIDKANRRLDLFNRSIYKDQVIVAVNAWDGLERLRYRHLNTKDGAEVQIFDWGSVNASRTGECYEVRWLGIWDAKHPDPDPKPDGIYFNRCLMTWDGGFFPAHNRNVGPVSPTRRARTVTHEIGHAHGLQHTNDFSQCQAVMRDIEPDETGVCYVPGSHDETDMANYWR